LRTAIDNLNGRVDEPLEDNDSALHLACLYGHLPCVQVAFSLSFPSTLIANVSVN
jgi:ankyrin repeat protein